MNPVVKCPCVAVLQKFNVVFDVFSTYFNAMLNYTGSQQSNGQHAGNKELNTSAKSLSEVLREENVMLDLPQAIMALYNLAQSTQEVEFTAK